MTHLETTLSAITALDSVLDLQRSLLLAAKEPIEIAKVKGQINGVLDQRIDLMKQRDQLKASEAAPVKQSRKKS